MIHPPDRHISFFKNAYRNVRKAYCDRQTTQSEFCFNWNQYSLWSRISAVEDNKVRSEEDGTSRQAHVNLVNKWPSGFRFHHVLGCFGVVWSQFLTTSKFLSAPETTTNNQEVKRSLYRLQNVNYLPKDYIHMCLTCRSISRRVVQLYQSCLTSRIHLFDFINISKHSRLINSNLLPRSKIGVVKDNEVRSEEDTRRGYSSGFLVGVCRPGLQIPTLFQT